MPEAQENERQEKLAEKWGQKDETKKGQIHLPGKISLIFLALILLSTQSVQRGFDALSFSLPFGKPLPVFL
jgi:hypothetical protein